jgi:hypothetical protein
LPARPIHCPGRRLNCGRNSCGCANAGVACAGGCLRLLLLTRHATGCTRTGRRPRAATRRSAFPISLLIQIRQHGPKGDA